MHFTQAIAIFCAIGAVSAGVARRQGVDDFSSESAHSTESVHRHGGDDDRGRSRDGSSSDDHPHTESHHGQDDSSTILATSTTSVPTSSSAISGASAPAVAQNTAPVGQIHTNGASQKPLFNAVGAFAALMGGALVAGVGL
ncbi:hypothetical protein ONZ45_g19530 [Pleurotus djamor]|nr:hypothetical protein ONZ45_g19530 [Pleurotus djamor]